MDSSRKTIMWVQKYEQMLFDMWEENIGILNGSELKSPTFVEFALRLQEAGFNVDWKKVRSKMDNLTKRYKAEVRELRKPDGKRTHWRHFKRLHRILGPIKSRKKLLSSTLDEQVNIDPNESDELLVENFDALIEEPLDHSYYTQFQEEHVGENENYSTNESVPTMKLEKRIANPVMTPFESAMIEVVKQRSKDLNQAAAERLEVLNRHLSSTIEFQNKLLKMMSN
ncbi:uncharacterized protein LOC133835645 isoform X2 [Drosophila sulfurigaster albostrigata]|uniref:uncharacterized protein LOC133835645 isoform X2 n=1 Tax=Drosophila sulfurigaster albostrigata TaxID=89887 RepID=UPI002D2199E1|nr:uncharacterized protein LOC133835645 isoform X2 [Drosophila sulfurigaster albostrigata]